VLNMYTAEVCGLRMYASMGLFFVDGRICMRSIYRPHWVFFFVHGTM